MKFTTIKSSVSILSVSLLIISGCTHYAAFPELEDNKGALAADEQNIAYDDSQNQSQAVKSEAKTQPQTSKPKQSVKKTEAKAVTKKDLSKPDTVIADIEEVNYVVPSKTTPIVIHDMDLIEMDAGDTKSKTIKPVKKTQTVLPVKKELKSAKNKKTTEPSVFYLAETIHFNNGGSVVESRYYKSLRTIVKEAKAHNGRIGVQGFASSRTRNTDIITHKMTNLKVSVARAENVAKILHQYGMPKSRIITEGLSDSRPIYKEVMPEGERLNRRAEVYISY